MVRQLHVWLYGQPIGTLNQADGRLSFAYAPAWLASAQAAPLSFSLPLQAEPFNDRVTRPFFAGLLPEGDKRRLVAQALQVSRQNDFALLDGIGGECAGAVTLLEPGQTPQGSATPNRVRWLDAPDLLRILDEMPQRPMLAGDGELRLSLAGAQDKLPVVVDGDRVGLPLFGSPSSHILKPAIEGIDGSVFNEAFCMSLAHALKLDVAPVEIRRVQDRAYLLVQRYDRLASANTATETTANAAQPQSQAQPQPQRLHQEDFCQALGVPPEMKYQNEGGPDLVNAFDLLRQATRPSAPHILKLLDFVLFNTLIGNHDAHGKNFSLLYTAKGAVLAPMYDALCTAVYPQLTQKMAMKIGSKYTFAELHTRHWEQFAASAGLSPAQVKKRLREVATRLPQLASETLAQFQAAGNPHPVLSPIVELINDRCATTLRRLALPASATGGQSPINPIAPATPSKPSSPSKP